MADIPARMVKRIEQGRVIMESMLSGPTEIILQALVQCRDDFMAELEGLSDEQIHFKPAADRWSIHQVALHVSHSMRSVGKLSTLLGNGQLEGEKPRMQPDIFDEDPGDWSAVLDLLREGFDVSLDAVRRADEASTPEDTLDHPWFGPFNCRQWAAFNVLHSRVHVNQLSKNKSSEGYPEQ